MNNLIKLRTKIIDRYPNANLTTLEELIQLVEKHDIKWVPSNEGNGAYFIMSQLSIIKGLDSDDYKKNWVNLTGSFSQTSLESLAGKAFKLEGNQLAKFKITWREVWGESLGRINSLWVGDWEHAYSYLVQGKSNTAKEFQSLGAKSVIKAVESDISSIDKVTRDIIYKSGWSNELDLQIALTYLASHSPFKLTPEYAVEDYPDSKTEVRRFDLLRVQPHKTKGKIVYCFELKKDIIDLCNVITTIEAKRYTQLLKDRFNTDNIKFYFVAPFGGTGRAFEKVQQYLDVEIWTAQKMSYFLLEKVKTYHPRDRYFVERILPQMDLVKKLLTLPTLPTSNKAIA
ncbi:hypothetical protein Nos7524_3228 [Nostoc sp. PCC 7524]|uniref:hypothetical protein n=1 Tax=Nostoc sp. (strain ATCC 29411 / PCC 7524) TaxID=28072 RepID=UPI00029F3A61|nr:hypothetical protein [Nostoc sp. PCC 7524]AFY49028.1 hypothetical protein Nos7524_3228 [Nostoc sp. PCC 7524]